MHVAQPSQAVLYKALFFPGQESCDPTPRYNMPAAADPTYPLYPIACILAAAMLLLVLFTSFVRQSWNLGVAFLCFWLFFENLTNAVNAIMWSDNAQVKHYVYCDIGAPQKLARVRKETDTHEMQASISRADDYLRR